MVCLPCPSHFSLLLGTIHPFAYPAHAVFHSCWVRFISLLTLPMPFFALAGYDSSLCLPCPCRFSLLLGMIPRFVYPAHAVFHFCWVRFIPLLTQPMPFFTLAGYDSTLCLPCPCRFSLLLGTILPFAYPPKSILGFTGPASISPQKKQPGSTVPDCHFLLISNAFQAQL